MKLLYCNEQMQAQFILMQLEEAATSFKLWERSTERSDLRSDLEW